MAGGPPFGPWTGDGVPFSVGWWPPSRLVRGPERCKISIGLPMSTEGLVAATFGGNMRQPTKIQYFFARTGRYASGLQRSL